MLSMDTNKNECCFYVRSKDFPYVFHSTFFIRFRICPPKSSLKFRINKFRFFSLLLCAFICVCVCVCVVCALFIDLFLYFYIIFDYWLFLPFSPTQISYAVHILYIQSSSNIVLRNLLSLHAAFIPNWIDWGSNRACQGIIDCDAWHLQRKFSSVPPKKIGFP